MPPALHQRQGAAQMLSVGPWGDPLVRAWFNMVLLQPLPCECKTHGQHSIVMVPHKSAIELGAYRLHAMQGVIQQQLQRQLSGFENWKASAVRMILCWSLVCQP